MGNCFCKPKAKPITVNRTRGNNFCEIWERSYFCMIEISKAAKTCLGLENI